MYNKIELRNNGKPFSVKFDWLEYKVPEGLFEAEQTLWNFIKGQALKWWLSVTVASIPQAPSVKKVEEDKISSKKEEVKNEVKEEVKEEIKVEKKKK